MENNVVSFVLENFWIFLPFGLAGIFLTIYLIINSKKTDSKNDILHNFKYNIKIFNKEYNFYLIIYIIFITTMIIIGFLSEMYTSTIIGGIFSSLPLILIIYFNYFYQSRGDKF